MTIDQASIDTAANMFLVMGSIITLLGAITVYLLRKSKRKRK